MGNGEVGKEGERGMERSCATSETEVWLRTDSPLLYQSIMSLLAGTHESWPNVKNIKIGRHNNNKIL